MRTQAASKSWRRRPGERISASASPCATLRPRRVKRLMRLKGLRAAVTLFSLCALCGCGVLGGASGTRTPPPSEPEHPPESASVTPLLELMSALPKGDPARQAELFQSAKDASALSPTTSNRLKYALALAIPGHSGSDPVAAQRQLSELLARPETLLPDERLLALVELQEV